MYCPICDSADYRPIPSAIDPTIERWRREESDNSAYEWRLCRRCANAYPLRQPNLRVLQKIWLQHKSTPGLSIGELERAWEVRRTAGRAIAARSFKIFAPLVGSTGRFLDIACGFGETVKTFAAHGWNAEGIDAIAHVHREMGIHVRYGQIEEVDLAAGYQIIHIAHAIYFITNPIRFLGEVRNHLASDGVFCVVLSDFFAHHDPSLPSYGHTFFPNAASMRYALALAGFETIICKKLSGSIYIAARPALATKPPFVSSASTLFLLRTKALRYALLGRPYLTLRRVAKLFIGRR
jgi:SAM-dependent methyltransferase